MAVWLLWGRGIPGRDSAPLTARELQARLGFVPTGDVAVALEVDQLVAWALDRSAGWRDPRVALGEGGAIRWRVEFSGGGTATVTAGGEAWSARRPVPTDPGPDLYPAAAQPLLVAGLARLVNDPSHWEAIRRQSWHEGGHLWHRARFAGGSGSLPPGWRREIDVEMIGSTVVAFSHRVVPLGTHIGVVTGRVRELGMLRVPGLVGLAIVAVGVLVAAARGWAFHFRLAPFKGLGAGLATALLAWVADAPPWAIPLLALVPAAVFAAEPLWASPPPVSPRWGGAAGVALAAAVSRAPLLVNALGGWLPAVPALLGEGSPAVLLASAALPALIEEPLLRGALPGMLAPLVGWWGGAIAGAAMGAVIHTVPSVPLIATLAVGLGTQLALVALARAGGLAAAMLARLVFEAIDLRGAYPVGHAWDIASLAIVLVGLGVMVWPRRAR